MIDALIAGLEARGLLSVAFEVCQRHGVLIEEVLGPGRTQAVTIARHDLALAIRTKPGRQYSYPEIGRLIGRDHTSVMAGIVKATAREQAKRGAA